MGNELAPELLEPQPEFFISDRDVSDLCDRKRGEKLRLIVGYQVIGDTKSFVILKIKTASVFSSSRSF